MPAAPNRPRRRATAGQTGSASRPRRRAAAGQAGSPAPKKPRVAIVGAGIAGLTAAYYLAARKEFDITVFEEKSFLGGNLATRNEATGVHRGVLDTANQVIPPVKAVAAFDIYPHMYQSWYKNFWTLLEDVGVELEQSFRAFKSVHQLRTDSKKIETLTYPYSLRYLLKNLNSGIASPTDLILFGYANVDLLAERRQRTVRLGNMSLTGYLNSRPYMTSTAIDAFESFISRVWAIPAYQISAADCQTYSEYCYAAGDENCWLATEPAGAAYLDKINTVLKSLGVHIKFQTRVTRVQWAIMPASARGQTPAAQTAFAHLTELAHQKTQYDEDSEEWVPEKVGAKQDQNAPEVRSSPRFDYVILALPPTRLAELARRGERGKRLVDAIPELNELSRIGSQRVPIVNVYFTRSLSRLPKDGGPIALAGSKLNLSVTNLSHVWHRLGNAVEQPVLAVTCSEPYGLTGPNWYDDGFAMIRELADYLQPEGSEAKVKVGSGWGDKTADIDWEKTSYYSNVDAQLSLNPIGTDQWRPKASPEQFDNVFFAGDCCQNDFGITTIEAAVATGVNAASAFLEARERKGVELCKPDRLPSDDYVALRWLWVPTMLAAKAASMAEGPGPGEGSGPSPKRGILGYLLTPGLKASERPERAPGT